MNNPDPTVEWEDLPEGGRRCQAAAIVDGRKVTGPAITISTQNYADGIVMGWPRQSMEKDVEDNAKAFLKHMLGG